MEPLDKRVLLAAVLSNAFIIPADSTNTSDVVVNGEKGTASEVLTSGIFQGSPALQDRTEETVGTTTTIETKHVAYSRLRGVQELDEKVINSDGNLLEIHPLDALVDYPGKLVSGQTTKLSKARTHVILHTSEGKFSGDGEIAQTVQVVGFERVDAGFVFPDAMKLVVDRVNSYHIASADGRFISIEDTSHREQWFVRGVGEIKEVFTSEQKIDNSAKQHVTTDTSASAILRESSLVVFSAHPVGTTEIAVQGTSAGDTISVEQEGNVLLVLCNGAGKEFDAAKYQRLYIDAKEGNDIVTIEPTAPRACRWRRGQRLVGWR